jgi:hypothetical protein
MTLLDWIRERLEEHGGGDVADAIGARQMGLANLHGLIGGREDDGVYKIFTIYRNATTHEFLAELMHMNGDLLQDLVPAAEITLLERRPTDETR